jgi:phosphoribosylglycinamide formyltransferase-1
VTCVVSSRGDAFGVERARRAALPVLVSRDEEEIARFLERRGVAVVALAGWMRMLSAAFLARFPGRVLNVHPSLLPAFPGAHGVEDALAYGVRVTGVTVHLVDEGMDTGPVVLQEALEVPYDCSASELAERLHEIEHRLLPEAVRALADGRIHVEGRKVRVTCKERA